MDYRRARRGQLKLSVCVNAGILSVSVAQGRHLRSKWKQKCDSYVKVSLVPDDTERTKRKTSPVEESNSPNYKQKLSFDLIEGDESKRLLISVWHQDQASCLTEFLGCMSFGVRHLLNPKKEVNGWYYLLTEDMGRKKHLQVAARPNPLSASDCPAITSTPASKGNGNLLSRISTPSTTPRCLSRLQPPTTPSYQGLSVCGEILTLTVCKNQGEYGFLVSGASPVTIDKIKKGSAADVSGLKVGDGILCVNGHNISSSSVSTFHKLIKFSGDTAILQVQRPAFVASPLHAVPSCHASNLDDEADKENRLSMDEVMFRQECTDLPMSTPIMSRKEVVPQHFDSGRDAIQCVIDVELDYIDLMHAGIERYSFPLRRCIVTQKQHSVLFQNIEKLVRISEFLIGQLQENMLSDGYDSETCSPKPQTLNLITSIASTYQSKLSVLCEAYQCYVDGMSEAEHLLSELMLDSSFQNFIETPPLHIDQPKLAAFLFQPLQHVQDLHRVLKNTQQTVSSSTEEHIKLKHITSVLADCICKFGLTSAHKISSGMSLASSQSKDSGTGTMKTSSNSGSRKSPRNPKAPYTSLQTLNSVNSRDKFINPPTSPAMKLYLEERQFI